jgi:hypothetical protein
MWLSSQASDSASECDFKLVQGADHPVLEEDIFQIAPNKFDGIEFRGVARQIQRLQARLDFGQDQNILHILAVVSGDIVPDNEQLAGQQAQQASQKLDHHWGLKTLEV